MGADGYQRSIINPTFKAESATTGIGERGWMERKTGFEPAISSLARRRFTTKPLPLNSASTGRLRIIAMQWCRGTDSNCRHRHFQCRALPPELPRRRIHYPTAPQRCQAGEEGIANYQFPTPSFLPFAPSFPRKQESTPRPTAAPGYAGVLDSGLRRNDGGGWVAPPSNHSHHPPRHSRPAPSFPRKRESTSRPFTTPE